VGMKTPDETGLVRRIILRCIFRKWDGTGSG
jgi:hypothetical protein